MRRFPGLHAIGFGIRHTGKKRQEHTSQGILFVVKEKKELPLGQKPTPEIRARLRVKHQHCFVSIPTDVIEIKNHKFEAAFASCDRAGNALVTGSACCALTTTPGSPAQYLLGCHHVFLASEFNPGLVPGPVAFVACNAVRIGTIAGQGQMNPGAPPTKYSNDAALAYIEPAARAALSLYWQARWYPKDVARSVPRQLPTNGDYGVFTDGGSISADYIGYFGSWTVPVGNGLSILLPAVLLYDAGNRTQPGDSGSPFYDKNTGIALGMHFARCDSDSTPSGFASLAEPMWHLTSNQGPFGMDLYLGR